MVDQKLDPTVRRPIMALLELLGRRWALRILWELRDRPLTSRALRAAAEISPTVLQSRVNELREAGIVTHSAGEGYLLTPLGHEMLEAFAPLHSFAEKWASAQIGRTKPEA
ncbi:winged helix-turn-helix transcriptional regulator [Sphingomonas sp. ERG5]|uniref:winged helix-turn-helix transcriptional regulator n=1 Tax=Sphingomonas sp. ERG5 TaxID=1381597 RepID=UPI00054B7F18|nr:helix-turn-helix domain-containing protein [Sphingomonas sp. ERG5]